MIMDMNIVTVPGIILCVYVISDFLKGFVFKTDQAKKNIPPVAAVIGGLFGIGIFYLAPETINAANIVEACTSGIASGLSAVGCNQILKQYQKFSNTGDKYSSDSDKSY